MLELDEDVIDGLRRTIAALGETEPRPVPIHLLAPLIGVARPGLQLRLDLDATKVIGAPLITVSQNRDLTRLLGSLTARQAQVARLIIEGLSNRAIGKRLGISLATVKDHVHAILHRLDLPSRTALIAAALPNASLSRTSSPHNPSEDG